MANILYTYHNQVYANITNKCDCRCTFCIRSHKDAIGEAEEMWHKCEPSLEEIKKTMDEFDFTEYAELVYCGYGEPTCALETLIASAVYAKERYNLKISLNAPTKECYEAVTRPAFSGAFDAMLSFASAAKEKVGQVQFSVVDVISEEEIAAAQKLADEMGIPLRVRKYS